ncbi:MAG TPA: molecular chaperone HtpG [Bacteroidales bacterium]|nr:molecular chaperone HtpG [Bacteroidales bacterium]HSA44119.1 molecular chaperone HtpG [Bacteroidales bacterium]
MQKGKINVQTENIFPIIKKFLYSEHEIFLRELISNAVDATRKLQTLASLGEFKGETGDLTIEVSLDTKTKTLVISDKGIGMTTEEIDKYINQIAFSSAEDFIKKYKGKAADEQNGLIGHFGLGFYSSFMVSKQVEIISKSYKKGPGSKAVRWVCDGSPEYAMDDHDRKERGTEVILHLADDSLEFNDEHKILDLLKKYCKFLPVPIRFGNEKRWEDAEGETDKDGKPVRREVEFPRIINNINPLWKQKPADLKDEDYKKFYRELYPYTFEEPLFQIHLNVDYPFNLTGILYFPKVKKYVDMQKNKIQLYCNQVYVTDSVEGIVPDFLTLLHGVIDSPDIPLNVSRSYLQSDSNVKKISNHITKKVADKLEDLFKNSREDFEKKWDDIRVFIEYGIVTEQDFYERAKKFCLLKNTEGNYFTLDEYQKKVEAVQTDKDKQLIYLYTTQQEEQHAYIGAARERGYDVLLMDGPLDNHFVNALESRLEKTHFKRVDAEVTEKLIPKEEALPSKLSTEEQDSLKPLFEDVAGKDKYHVQFEALSETDLPVMITQPEFMRRMKDMAALGGGMNYWGEMPESLNLVINSNHPAIGQLLQVESAEEKTGRIRQLTDLALLSQNMLRGEELTKFISRSIELLK